MRNAEPELVLIGGGHAHVAVLAEQIRKPLSPPQSPGRITLVSPSRHLRYSGMVPGWIVGEYSRDEGVVELEPLCQAAGVRFVCDAVVALDPEARSLETASGEQIQYDLCSINAGGVGHAQALLGSGPDLLDVRPISGFVERLGEWLGKELVEPRQIAVIGGGAGGVELAFAIANREDAGGARVRLIAGAAGLLPGFGSRARRLVRHELERQGIALREEDARLDDGELLVAGEKMEPVELIIAAVGSGAPDWPRTSGLAVDTQGFVAVDQFQRSISHPDIFAVGDVAARQDRTVPHSGVHAVHAGPVLAANLRAVLSGGEPQRVYRPRPTSLYLIATGNGSAIGTYGPLAVQGRWVQKLKRWIDKRWIATYSDLARAV